MSSRVVRVAAAALSAALLGGCATWTDGPAYYWQSMVGHLDVVGRARPIDAVIADPATDATLRARLERAREIRAFASSRLGLPDNGSYAKYSALDRPFVLWNVFATPELSLRLERWCFPVAGCVAYRGYYDRDAAEAFALRLREQGLETHVGGVPAYSTLGWFDDPLLSTFIAYPEAELARLVFHELAHQLLYVAGDTPFNESFATAVEEAGVERWLAHRADPELERAYRDQSRRRLEFVALLRRYKDTLASIYAGDGDEAAKRAGKARTFEALRADYATMKAGWGGFAGYDRFFASGPTNPQLAAVGAYNDLLPAFRAMLAREGGDLPRFYAAVRALAALPKADRDARLRELG
ncbi:MAG: aminopeptidase, partial [Burkholderiales bacterium]